jgi:hypothetical protein
MKKIMLLVLILLPLAQARTFVGNGTIVPLGDAYSASGYYDPGADKLAICTDDVKYRAEPGDTLNFLLYIRNPMAERPYQDLHISLPSDALQVELSQEYIDMLAPQEVRIINVSVHIPAGTRKGDYPTDIVVRTRDYPFDGFKRTKLFIVTDIWEYEHEFLVLLTAAIIVLLLFRYRWIQKTNSLFRSRFSKPGAKNFKARKRRG